MRRATAPSKNRSLDTPTTTLYGPGLTDNLGGRTKIINCHTPTRTLVYTNKYNTHTLNRCTSFSFSFPCRTLESNYVIVTARRGLDDGCSLQQPNNNNTYLRAREFFSQCTHDKLVALCDNIMLYNIPTGCFT